MTRHNPEICERFGLSNGQFFAEYKFKNLWWVLDGEPFGYGDLRQEDITRIFERLEPDEIFLGWNEHHNTNLQQTMYPILRITNKTVTQPDRAARLRAAGEHEPSMENWDRG